MSTELSLGPGRIVSKRNGVKGIVNVSNYRVRVTRKALRASMRIRSIEPLVRSGSGNELIVKQRFSNGSRQIRGLLVLASGLLLSIPFAVIATDAGGRQVAIALAHDNPLAATQLVIVAVLAITATLIGGRLVFSKAVRQRTIRIDQNRAVVEDLGRGGAEVWSEPLSSFHGVRHHVITTSEGAVHTLRLEHSRPQRTLLLFYQSNIDANTVADTANRLSVPVLPAGGWQKKPPTDGPGTVNMLAKPELWLARITRLASRLRPVAASR